MMSAHLTNRKEWTGSDWSRDTEDQTRWNEPTTAAFSDRSVFVSAKQQNVPRHSCLECYYLPSSFMISVPV
jgi:hypothetical protein